MASRSPDSLVLGQRSPNCRYLLFSVTGPMLFQWTDLIKETEISLKCADLTFNISIAMFQKRNKYSYQGCGAVTFLDGSGSSSGSSSGSGELFWLRLRVKIFGGSAPSKMYRFRRPRLRCLKTKKKILNNATYLYQKLQMSKYDLFLAWSGLWIKTKPVIVIVTRLKLLAKHVT